MTVGKYKDAEFGGKDRPKTGIHKPSDGHVLEPYETLRAEYMTADSSGESDPKPGSFLGG